MAKQKDNKIMSTESLIAIVASLSGVVSTLVTVISYAIAHTQESKAKAKAMRDEVRKKLSKQLIAYYYEEQVMISELSKVTGKPEQTIKKEMRTNAQNHAENLEHVYPNMTANQARDYIYR